MFRIDQFEVHPAVVEYGNNNAYFSSSLVFRKPSWISDEKALHCAICSNKFNQLRRRHHCRCCGKVLCNKCCIEKVPLPQYGLDNPERVCSACVPVASCVTMSFSTDPTFHLRAAEGMSLHCRDSPASVISLGGVHVLVFLTKKAFNQLAVLKHVASGLHSLACHECLSMWLADLGALSAITQILTFCSDGSNQKKSEIAIDCLSALRFLVKTNNKLRILTFELGSYPVLLKLCDDTDPSVALIATSTLCLLAECPENHKTFIAQQNLLRNLLCKISKSFDEQVKEHVLRIMVILSTGDDNVKHIIATEDATSGSVLAHALQSKPQNLQIVASAAGAVANLATNEKDQVLLQSSLRAVLSEILCSSHPDYVRVQLIRALANFSKHSGHSYLILNHLQNFINFFDLKNTNITFHLFRCIFNLLKFQKKETVALLCRNGVDNFLLQFTELDDVMNKVMESLSNSAPPVTS